MNSQSDEYEINYLTRTYRDMNSPYSTINYLDGYNMMKDIDSSDIIKESTSKRLQKERVIMDRKSEFSSKIQNSDDEIRKKVVGGGRRLKKKEGVPVFMFHRK